MWETNAFCLTDLGTVNRGKSRHRPRDDKSLYGGVYPFIQTGDVKSSNFYLTKYSQTYNEKGLQQSKLWEKGTLCITIAANIAETAILGIDACFPDSIVGFIPYKDKADVRYIKYYFDLYKKHMQAISLGATQDNFSLDKMLKVKFIVPSLPIQQKIAEILSAYDDLIENNNRRIELLEQAAQQLYKEWFVRFRFPGHEKVRFTKGIPDGWEVTKLENLINFYNGKATENIESDGYPIYGSNGIIGYSNTALYEDGIILGRVGAYCGSVEICKDEFWASDNTIVVKPFKIQDLWFCYYLLKSMNLNLYAGGSAQPLITQGVLKRIKTFLPEPQIRNHFGNVISIIHEQIQIFQSKNQNLIKQRDILLPRLMSGKLEV